jgi:hypothetical protein
MADGFWQVGLWQQGSDATTRSAVAPDTQTVCGTRTVATSILRKPGREAGRA